MEVHSPDNSLTVKKKLWNILRVAFYMMRKGISTKRKLLMDMNLMMKRGKIIGKSLGNLMFHHSSNKDMYGGVPLHHYEFSCSNTPNLVSFHVAKRKHLRFLSVPHFPCINPPDEPEEPRRAVSLPKIEYSPEYACSSFRFDTPDLAPGEMLSPLKSPFAIRVSNFSAMEEENDNRQVDTDAEEFIRLFYEQLRIQSRTQLLQYQEMQYQEMLARGT